MSRESARRVVLRFGGNADGNGEVPLRTIYDLFAAIYERPWLVFKSVTKMEHFVHGFLVGLDAEGCELSPSKPPLDGFAAFMQRRHGITQNIGWSQILLELADGDDALAFALFFEELDCYRELDGAAPMFREPGDV